jgi:hypothetical protein
MIPRYTYTAYGFTPGLRYAAEPIATFFSYSDAAVFAMRPERDGFEQRNVFVSAGSEDKRTSGYRYEAPQVGQSYAEWCAEVDVRKADRLTATVASELRSTMQMQRRAVG